ncbi:hypothetical protein NDU88_008303 [Pleurodeles waltl]|uniref:Uncharacterized protein n=1 Tax=Pleurodeles waltl TaxID=8319 RepID=A0AAV7NVM4_PLEWA|nr:hypothetical protein NDU88_008303 [Pleurodeles waltl]
MEAASISKRDLRENTAARRSSDTALRVPSAAKSARCPGDEQETRRSAPGCCRVQGGWDIEGGICRPRQVVTETRRWLEADGSCGVCWSRESFQTDRLEGTEGNTTCFKHHHCVAA